MGPWVWHGAIAAAVAAPLARGGFLLLLDFALVRNVPVVWLPTEADPGPTNAAPTSALLWVLARLGPAAAPVFVFALFLGIGMAAHHATKRLIMPSLPVAAYFAGTLYAVNPFTYERLMAGHLLLLMAYGIAPLVVLALVRFVERPGARRALALAAGVTAIAWTSIHYLAMLPLLLGAVVVVRRATWRTPVLRWGALAAGVVLVANVWWIAGLGLHRPGGEITGQDLDHYATRPRSTAVIGNTAALYGFWHREFRLPKDGVDGWWLLFAPIAGLSVWGLGSSLGDRRLRALGAAMIVVVPTAIVLASGTSFPATEGLFRWAFDTIPGFKLFREPQKWVALLPLAYALLGAVGLDRLLGERTGPRPRSVTAFVAGFVALMLPLAYAWTLVWNWERLRPVEFPADWSAADDLIESQGGGRMLFLPWHLYMTMSFTEHRVVNPAPYFFSAPVLSGDNVELGTIRTQSTDPESEAVEAALFTPEGRRTFGDALARLCVRWVVLAKEDDHRGYEWLRSVPQLDLAMDTPGLIVWRVDATPSPACRTRDPVP